MFNRPGLLAEPGDRHQVKPYGAISCCNQQACKHLLTDVHKQIYWVGRSSRSENECDCGSEENGQTKMAIIETHNLTMGFRNITAVEDLNLEVEEGEVIGFLGPNGAGKPTLIRMLAGIIAATSGYAEIAGQRTDGDIERLHEVIG